MLFHTLDYVIFLALTVLLYWGLPRGWRVGLLGVASLAFYASWSLIYLPVMLMVVGVAWLGGRWLGTWHRFTGHGWRRAAVMGLLLLPLVFFKYWDWIAENIEMVGALVKQTWALPRVAMPLPVGVSFFTFQAIAYLIDVGRAAEQGKDASEPSLWRFTTFQTFFPQLVAGPIVRGHELLPQILRPPALREHQIGAGVLRICRGMAKKLLIADPLRLGMIDPIFNDPAAFTGVERWVALYAYTLQIYADFSGYTDIAIGSARLFGIELPENFRRPYLATSVSEFWRRWHITLSDWIRDYLYFPLGGSQGGELQTYRNLMITLVIIGVWHGASWNFVLYGLLHGAVMVLERWRRKRAERSSTPAPAALGLAWRWALTFHFVVLARILFRTDDLASAADFTAGLTEIELLLPRFSPTVWAIFALGWLLHFTPEAWPGRAEAWAQRQTTWLWVGVAAATGAMAMVMSSGEQLAFVYYQF
ncbi:MAG: hypothetical protein RL071_4912 [Pseudomonadota bacterium]